MDGMTGDSFIVLDEKESFDDQAVDSASIQASRQGCTAILYVEAE
jgi:hypothetical protein